MLMSCKNLRNTIPVTYRQIIIIGIMVLLLPWTGSQAQYLLERDFPVRNRWLLCAPDPLAQLIRVDTGAPEDVPIEITADTGQSSEAEAVVRGDVIVEQGDRRLEASEVIYDRLTNVIDAEGDVNYGDPSFAVYSDRAHVNLDEQTGWFSESDYYVASSNAQGDAERVDVQYRKKTAQLQQITYSTCNRGDEFWELRASELKLNQETGRGSAKHMTLALWDVPVLYFPYLSFPINKERQSGFLAPDVGLGSENGIDIRIPYYWNIAPNQDMTLATRVMSKRGLMLGTEYRFLTPRGRGELDVEYLPEDFDRGGDRAGVYAAAQVNPRPELYGNLLFQYVSDDDYLDDFSNNLDLLSQATLERHLDIGYFGNNWTALGRLQSFQTIDNEIFDDADTPYDRLPQLLFDGEWPDQAYGLSYGMRNELVHFDHGQKVRGLRLDVWPRLSWPLRRPAGFVIPEVGYRYTAYDLRETTGTGFADNPTRGAPIVSLDSGLIFERPVNWRLWHIQPGFLTLEPRLYYLYVPFRDQTDIPVFDSTLIDQSFSWLFLENRFTGADRLGDANQLTAAVTSRLLNPRDGSEQLRVSLGRIQYFRDRKVTLPGSPPGTTDESPFIFEGFVNLRRDLSVRGGLIWDFSDNDISRSGLNLIYRPGAGRLVNFNYRFAESDEIAPEQQEIEQLDLTTLWTINEQWRTVGRVNYSITDNQFLTSFAGFEYDQCCWAFRMLGRFKRNNPQDDGEFAVVVQLELKGLTNVGTDIPGFLEDAILGYEQRSRY